MSALVIAEHDNAALAAATLNTITAACRLDDDVHVLVAGAGCAGVADAAARVAGVGKVRVADDPAYANQLAENLATLITGIASEYSHVLVAATKAGKNVLPRAAALLDVSPISDISGIESADTFVRPIYAGNAIATVQSSDPIKLVSVRATSFDAAPEEGGVAVVETVEAAGDSGLSAFVGQDLTQSERPELTSARIVISGGRGMQSGTISRSSKTSPTSSGPRSALPGPRSTPDSSPTTTRSARPGRWSPPISTSRWGSRARSSTLPE